jgi:hypothetical protein
MRGAWIGTALRARLSIRRVKDGGKIEVVAALQSTSFLESAMSTLLHGPAPT